MVLFPHPDGSQRFLRPPSVVDLPLSALSCQSAMPGGAVNLAGPTDLNYVEAPVTIRAYLLCAFAAFGGIFL